jgi:hypothetical protein
MEAATARRGQRYTLAREFGDAGLVKVKLTGDRAACRAFVKAFLRKNTLRTNAHVAALPRFLSQPTLQHVSAAP